MYSHYVPTAGEHRTYAGAHYLAHQIPSQAAATYKLGKVIHNVVFNYRLSRDKRTLKSDNLFFLRYIQCTSCLWYRKHNLSQPLAYVADGMARANPPPKLYIACAYNINRQLRTLLTLIMSELWQSVKKGYARSVCDFSQDGTLTYFYVISFCFYLILIFF